MRHVLPVLVALSLPVAIFAADWPQFRGPRGDGIADETSAPTRWSAEENIAWKAPLPHAGNGSPIVVAGRVFVACPEDGKGLKRSLYCFDALTGVQRWVRTIDFGRELPTHETNPHSSSTPASDGERVVVWHGTAGLHCYDLDGNSIWSKDLGEFVHMWGDGSSPVTHDGRIILGCTPGAKIFLTALDLATGETLWRVDEPQDGDGQKRSDGGYVGDWSTPYITQVRDREVAIYTWPTRVAAYDLVTGDEVWSCQGVRGPRGDLSYSSPLVGNGLCMVTGGFKGPSLAVRIDGRGDVTDTARLWRIEENPQSIGSGVLLDGFAYLPYADPGIIQCVDMSTGDIRWRDRGAGGAAYWGSAILVGENLYATNQNGDTVVFRPDPEKYDQVAVNSLGEASNSTPAAADGRLYIRTAGHLWCIAE